MKKRASEKEAYQQKELCDYIEQKHQSSTGNETYPRTSENLPTPPPAMISIGKTKRDVLGLLEKGGNAHSIAKKLHLSKPTVIQHLQEMEKLLLTEKKLYSGLTNGYWTITKKGIDYLGGRFSLVGYERGGVGTTDWLQDRAHNLKIKLEVKEKPDNQAWLSDWGRNDKIKNNVFYTQRFGEIITTFTGKSLIFQLPILYFKDSEIALAEAGRIGQALKQKYEEDVEGLRLGDSDVTMQLISQSHAIPQEPYAKFCKEHGFSYRDEMLEIDASKSPELEFTDKDDSHIHHSNYIDYVKDFAKQKVPTASEIAKLAAQTQKQLQELSQHQLNTNTQLQSVITLLKPPKQKPKENDIDRNVNAEYIG